MVVVLNRIDVYQLTTASVSGTIEAGRRVSAVTFLAVSGGTRSQQFWGHSTSHSVSYLALTPLSPSPCSHSLPLSLDLLPGVCARCGW